MEVNFWTHACCEIVCGKTRIITDPWLSGPAFLGGWWLKHEPPRDWLRRLATADAVYISHNHSDHMHPETLQILAAENPNVRIIVPAFDSRSAEKSIKRYGFRNVQAVTGETDVGSAEVTIIEDKGGRDDSGVYVRDLSTGETLLNVVDAGNLNGGNLPEDVDWLLAPFGGNASGYPLCYRDQYFPEEVYTITMTRKRVQLYKLQATVKRTRPKRWMPFASYFLERDPYIRNANRHNTQLEAIQAVGNMFPAVKIIKVPEPMTTVIDDAWQVQERALHYPEAYEEYFSWCGWTGVMRLTLNGTSVMCGFNQSPRSMDIKVPQRILDYVLYEGLGWEEMVIGYHARIKRTPDVYEADFWDHFQNHLPEERPWAKSSS